MESVQFRYSIPKVPFCSINVFDSLTTPEIIFYLAEIESEVTVNWIGLSNL